jgi:uncharacterized protein YciI
MPVFAVEYTYTADTGRRDEVRPTHRAFLRELQESGVLLASGPFAEGDPDGALLVVRADDAVAAARVFDADPFAVAGLVADRRVRGWTQVFGPWVDGA